MQKDLQESHSNLWKNLFLVCDDADVDHAFIGHHYPHLAMLVRDAATSRILVFENVYKEFLTKFIDKAKS